MYKEIDELINKEHKKLSKSRIYRFLDDQVIVGLIEVKSRRKVVWDIARKFGVKPYKIWNWNSPDYTLEKMAQILVDNKLSPSLNDALSEVKSEIDWFKTSRRAYDCDRYPYLLPFKPYGQLTYPSGHLYDGRSGFEFYEDDKKDSSRKYKLRFYDGSLQGHPV